MGRRPQVDTLGILKSIVDDFYDNGILEEPLKRRIINDLDDKRVEALKKLVELVMETPFFNEEVKLFIGDYKINYNGVVDELTLKYNKEFNIRTVSSKINYMKSKFEKTFGNRMLLNLTLYTRENIDEYIVKINNELDNFRRESVLDGIDLNFPDTSDKIIKEVEEEEFSDFIDVIAPYTKKCKRIVEESIDKDVLAYIRNICTSTNLSDIDKERLEQLKELIE